MEVLNFILKLTMQLLQWSLKLFFQAVGVLFQGISAWLRSRPAHPSRDHSAKPARAKPGNRGRRRNRQQRSWR